MDASKPFSLNYDAIPDMSHTLHANYHPQTLAYKPFRWCPMSSGWRSFGPSDVIPASRVLILRPFKDWDLTGAGGIIDLALEEALR